MTAYTYTCPHCGKSFAKHMAIHLRICPSREDVRPLILACLADPAQPGQGLPVSGYRSRHLALPVAQRGSAPTPKTLIYHFGSWAQTCQHFGLAAPADQRATALARTRARREAAAVERVGAEIDADMEAAQRALEGVRDHGLTVCSVRKLPSGGTAYMLR